MKKEALEKQGWIKQTTYDEPRLSDIVEMYEEMGLEVRIEPFNPDENDAPGCSECMKAQPDRYKTIYTREKSQP
jgi:uncharacterized protein (UPF0305 family)